MMRRLTEVVLLACVMSCAWASLALAQQRAVVREFEGPSAKRVRAAVVSALEDHSVELVGNEEAEQSASSGGFDLGTDSGREGVARDLRVSTFIEGSVERAGARLRATVTVYDGNGGGKVGSFTVGAPKNKIVNVVKDRVWKGIASDVEKTSVPAKPVEKEPEPEAAREDEEEEKDEPVAEAEPAPESEEDAFEGEHSPLDISVGARFSNRDFAYKDALPGLRDYELGMSPSFALHAHWYPGAHVTDGIAANLGLDLRLGMMLGVESKNTAGVKFPTSSTTLGAGLRWRIPLDENEVGVLLGYSMHSFSISDSSGGADPGVPDVSHGSLRVGADARWKLMDPLSLNVGAAYLLSLSPGEIADSKWFPNAGGGGVEAEIGLGFGVVEALELQLAFELQRYFFTLDPKPTDASVTTYRRAAGGALDQFMAIRASIVWRM